MVSIDVNTLNIIADNVQYQIEHNLRSRILVADWDSFKKCVEYTEYQLIDNSLEPRKAHSFSINGDIEFTVRQTVFTEHYEEGSPKAGFGFENFECLECGCGDLLYDEKEGIRYCPFCG